MRKPITEKGRSKVKSEYKRVKEKRRVYRVAKMREGKRTNKNE